MSILMTVGVVILGGGVLTGLLLVMTIEPLMAFFLPVSGAAPLGLQESARSAFALRKLKFFRPKLLVFEEPAPMVLAIRGLGGKGLILLSQGVIATRDENQLHQILASAGERLGEGWPLLESVAVLMVSMLSRLRPKGLSPLSFLLGWAVEPYFRYFLVLSERRKVFVGLTFYPDPDLVNVFRQR